MSSIQVNFVQRTPVEVMEEMDGKFQIVLDIRRLMVVKRKAKLGTISLIKVRNEFNKMYSKYARVLEMQGYRLHALDTADDKGYMVRMLSRLIQVMCMIIPEDVA